MAKRITAMLLTVLLVLSLIPAQVFAAAYPSDSKALGIDVSVHQGQIDWEKVKAAGIEFAIIRCGYGQDYTSQDDQYFAYNVAECQRLGIPFGLYLYSYATTVTGASGEADHAIRLINTCKDYSMFKLPMYYDLEENSAYALANSTILEMAQTFHDKVESATGITVGVYANTNWFNNKLTDSWYQSQPLWVAQYNTYCAYNGTYQIWQYTSSGSVDGISGRVDMNYMLVELSEFTGDTDDDTSGYSASLVTDKDSYACREAIMVTAATDAPEAWVALYPATSAVNSANPSVWWYYLNNNGTNIHNNQLFNLLEGSFNSGNSTVEACLEKNSSGTIVGAVKPGTYYLYVLEGNYNVLAKKQITITGDYFEDYSYEPDTYSLTTDKTVYQTDSTTTEPIYVTANNVGYYAWVGLYKADDTDLTGLMDYYYTYNLNGKAVDIINDGINWNSNNPWPLPVGQYKLVLFANESISSAVETVYITVGTPTLTTDADTYCMGSAINVTTDYEADGAWIGLYKSGETYGSASTDALSLYWYNISGAGMTDVNILEQNAQREGDYTPGEYQLYLFADSGYNMLASKTITVEACSDADRDHSCDSCGSTVSSHVYDRQVADERYLKTGATCTEGAEYYYSCACGMAGTETFTYGGQEEHTTTKVDARDAGCTESGNIEYYTCVCGQWFLDAAAAEPIADRSSVMIPAVGHKWADATCDTPKTCSVCHETEGEALGHSWDEGIITKAPSFSEDGEITYTCAACQASRTQTVEKTGFSGVLRVYGDTRYDTAFAAADLLKDLLGIKKFDYIVVASGEDFADALSGSYLAAVKDAPILLVRNRAQEMNKVKEYIKENLAPGGTVYLLGGTKAVPAAMENDLDGFSVKRLGGATRYDTNLLILKEAGVGDNDILVCTGVDFADSLSASAAGLPILLVRNSLLDDQKDFLSSTSGEVIIVGGTNAVNARIETELKVYDSDVKRLAGKTRYETSILVAKEFFTEPVGAVLAYAQNFPDGLAGGPLAYAMNVPLILTTDEKPSEAQNYAKAQGIQNGVVMGGRALISDKVAGNIFRVSADSIAVW